MLIIKDLNGNEAPITNNSEVTKNRKLNQVTQLTTTIYDFDENKIGFEMVVGTPRLLMQLPDDGQYYRIMNRDEVSLGDVKSLQITAYHVLHDLNDYYVKSPNKDNDTNDKAVTLSLFDFLNYITKNTPFTFTIHGTFSNCTFDNYPEGRALDLFLNDGLKKYGYEFIVDNYHIDIYKRIGLDNSFVFIDRGNASALSRSYDDTTMATHIIGSCKPPSNNDSDKDNTIYSEYTSPHASVYGHIDAEPYSDSIATNQQQLIGDLKNHLQDYPLMQIKLDYHEFKDNLIDSNNKIDVGNSGFIKDRKDVDISSRIIEVTSYLQSPTCREPQLTFGNVIGNFSDTIANLQTAKNDLNKMNKSLPDVATESIKGFFSGSHWTESDVKNYGRK